MGMPELSKRLLITLFLSTVKVISPKVFKIILADSSKSMTSRLGAIPDGGPPNLLEDKVSPPLLTMENSIITRPLFKENSKL